MAKAWRVLLAHPDSIPIICGCLTRIFTSNTSALVITGQMVASSLHRYQVRALTPILINFLSRSQLAKGFLKTNYIFYTLLHYKRIVL
jgi:hypothetical protein